IGLPFSLSLHVLQWEYKANPLISLNAAALRTRSISMESGAKWRQVILQVQVEHLDSEAFHRTMAATQRGLEYECDSVRECEVSLEKGMSRFSLTMHSNDCWVVATGYFDTMDPICGIPPCPNDYAWDYGSMMCISCKTGVAPPKVVGGDAQQRREIRAQESGSEPDTLQKRVTCPTLGAFNILGQRLILRLRNRVEAWTPGSEEGPTAEQLIANAGVQAAFQVACYVGSLVSGSKSNAGN
ncbi:hypothetical protein H0H93_011615, partial [Arthromyces matolae]